MDKKLAKFGPGGINCPCCRPTKTKKAAKGYATRKVRNAAKKAIRNEGA